MYLEQQRKRLNFSKKDKVLFLQGPAGSFFSRFSFYVKEKGAQTFHVNFNLGDKFLIRIKTLLISKIIFLNGQNI